jgi:N-carbamoylputrescine amidase
MPIDPFAANAGAWVASARVDLLITSEMPFGYWIAEARDFESAAAMRLCESQELGTAWLQSLASPFVLTSRACRGTERLRNQAIVLRPGTIEKSHDKRYMPQEHRWFEESWFERGSSPPRIFDAGGIRLGILLCTEAMFPEEARTLGLLGADLIAVPRASGDSTKWDAALAMAAVSAGAYVVSVNRDGGCFAGGAQAFSPNGDRLMALSDGCNFPTFELAMEVARSAKASYPRDVFARLSDRERLVAGPAATFRHG